MKKSGIVLGGREAARAKRFEQRPIREFGYNRRCAFAVEKSQSAD